MDAYRFFSIILLTIISGCSIQKNTHSINGNWCACSTSGDYIEMYVVEDQYKYVTDFQYHQDWNEYSISGDTLIQSNVVDLFDTIFQNKGIIRFISESQISINYLTSDEFWVLNKLKEPITDLNNDSLLIAAVEHRSALANCQGLRSGKERANDSITFQF